jgi:hypothetical protein
MSYIRHLEFWRLQNILKTTMTSMGFVIVVSQVVTLRKPQDNKLEFIVLVHKATKIEKKTMTMTPNLLLWFLEVTQLKNHDNKWGIHHRGFRGCNTKKKPK